MSNFASFAASAPSDSDKPGEEIIGNNTYHPGIADVEYDELHVQCPPHTTERKLITKIDWKLIPFLCILYLLAFLDRVNIANAKSFHLVEDLNLRDTEYNTALTIFFVPYIVAEIPSNILMKKVSPRVWLPTCMLGFGIASVCQGLVQNYSGLLATRFFLGLFESGMFPGCFYLISMWYKRSESQKRYSLFFSSTSLAGAFGGLLASAIGKMQGMRGYNGWRWIFILEGALTVVVALIFFFIFPSFPEQAKWLTEEERVYIKARLQADQGHNAAERKITFRDVVNVMKDHRIWLGGFMYFGLIVPAYSYAFFAPTIISTYHYDAIQTQLHSVPPWAASFVFSILMAALSDKLRHRAAFALVPLCLCIAAFATLLKVHNNTPVQYAMLHLVTMGTYSILPITVCWFSMNLGGHHRRAIGTGWQIGFGNIGGIIATFAFLSKDSPNFTKGYAICLGFTCISGIASLLYLLSIYTENQRRKKAVRDVGLSEYEKTELGDLNPEFRYMY
ncbi:MFS general substrate transporter [Annulohypoxylon maeteangense]|uniref:MFS general substrate transporter n=1 Tax=Annulohypoxylon maeteangense TaxID=1927788 RepID=UPI002008DA7B|nr:MFS general substrate transporter [Annulohypoxylon maeteangense]KAI0887492.1 MFS general substrate transporter [Annulohypoxylon maeteangense]